MVEPEFGGLDTSKQQQHVGIHSFSKLAHSTEMAAVSQDTIRYLAYAALNVMIAREVNSIVVDPYMVGLWNQYVPMRYLERLRL